jgi:hypothetical protein
LPRVHHSTSAAFPLVPRKTAREEAEVRAPVVPDPSLPRRARAPVAPSVGGALAVRSGAVTPTRCRLDEAATARLTAWAARVEATHDDPFASARVLARRLGATPATCGRTEVGFWVPDLDRRGATEAVLEVLTPLDPVQLGRPEQQARFHAQRVALVKQGEYLWGVVEGMRPGSKDRVGSFYQIRYEDPETGEELVHHDHFAASLPFGAFAPAELYDLAGMRAARKDQAYFAGIAAAAKPGEVPRQTAPSNVLQVHVPTATERGSIAGLTERFRNLADKLRSGTELAPDEEILAGYDAVQLLPIAPTIEHEGQPGFFLVDREGEGVVTATLRRPDVTNWGYDNVMAGTPAVAPTVLETKRPDELQELIETLHTFPTGPIKLVLDVVYGHIDNQAVGLVEDRFIAGQGMYGKTVNYADPTVRAQMLEMQRRKSDFGVDGVRVDGAQDFKVWEPESGTATYDDAYLRSMSEVTQEVAGHRYRPWMIFEDGRPWPDGDWEQKSTYREVTDDQPHAYQWGPLTFAHNTPMVVPFWLNKAWRAKEVASHGDHWITGVGNHDTLRRGAQVPTEDSVDPRLGTTLLETIAHAYDHGAATAWTYGFMPGVPMDFLQANARAPWAFVRNTDDRYSVKVASEESRFLEWRVDEERFVDPTAFSRLKTLGFDDLTKLRKFWRALEQVNTATGDDLDKTARAMAAFDPPENLRPVTVDRLKQLARAFMDDLHEYVNVDRHARRLDDRQTAFGLAAREFRRDRPWLADHLGPKDAFRVRQPADGAAVYYGLRTSPDGTEQLLFVGNMQGQEVTLTPAELDLPGLDAQVWEPVLRTPGLGSEVAADRPVTLTNAEAVVFRRAR